MAALTLRECLSGKTKEQLIELNRFLLLQIPQARKKAEFVERIAASYEEDPRKLLMRLGASVPAMCAIAAKSEDRAFSMADAGELNDVMFEPDMLIALSFMGLAKWDDERYLFSDFLCGLGAVLDDPEEMRFLRESQVMELFIKGAINAYGAIEQGELVEMMAQRLNAPAEAIKAILFMRVGIYRIASFMRLADGNDWWVSDMVEAPDDLAEEIGTRGEIARRIFSDEELLNAAWVGFPVEPPYFDEIAEALAGHDEYEDIDDAAMELIGLIFDLNNDELSGNMPDFVREITWDGDEEIRRVIGWIVDFMNGTPRWIHKGWTPDEVSGRGKARRPNFGARKGNIVQLPTRRDTPKVGRNDPCPCGSGKKYKNCCGGN